jgi:hypothetical protein
VRWVEEGKGGGGGKTHSDCGVEFTDLEDVVEFGSGFEFFAWGFGAELLEETVWMVRGQLGEVEEPQKVSIRDNELVMG